MKSPNFVSGFTKVSPSFFLQQLDTLVNMSFFSLVKLTVMRFGIHYYPLFLCFFGGCMLESLQ